jgi:hypothetical protein
MSIDFQRTTQRCIPEDICFHNYHCEHLKSYKYEYILALIITSGLINYVNFSVEGLKLIQAQHPMQAAYIRINASSDFNVLACNIRTSLEI